MILLTSTQCEQLLANGRQRDVDHIPVVKFFNPLGSGVWLATELDSDGDILFGLADLGFPELGSWSLGEMQAFRLPFDMRIERDLHFTGDFPISVWADMARRAGGIREAERILYSGARAPSTPTPKPTDTQSRKH
ncbi:single-stranded DNA endonuclease [Pacificimonas flava]|uniref:Single-stranded DNA endonuclease n=2 Tax=Pacificimonas TaxID=1960290 RepID=A0A219B4V8_9SPHN|nr:MULTISPECIES: DUF2958 domain-containing protein [Pacificimonas]MBZ6379418.1 DUF2958 domain-containing protein [Pacificimonas aurantium]OWV33387.1 single-stranded DNA endonuclease [Pacificimonas flava]